MLISLISKINELTVRTNNW